MSELTPFLTDDHRACDGRLADAETHAQAGRWDAARAAWAEFTLALGRHFGREEELLFPAFEDAVGSSTGPTAVMRMEHDQARALLGPTGAALEAGDAARFLAGTESLMVLLQQHNMKEEQVLYRMCDQVLPERAALLARIAAHG